MYVCVYVHVLAMISCPVGSIRTRFSDPIVKSVIDNVFPAEIDPLRIPGVRALTLTYTATTCYSYIHTFIHTYIHLHTFIHIYIHLHTCIHSYIHI